MSSARRKGPAPAVSGASGKRTASTARSIAWGIWLRRLAGFLAFDALLVAVLLGAFVAQCNLQLPADALWWGPLLRRDVAAALVGQGAGLDGVFYQVVLSTGEVRLFPLSQAFGYAVPVLMLTTVCEVLALLAGFSIAPRIRRQLKPLNELALTAEAIGSAVASDSAKLESLEHAISSATVDSPQVSTGDADLRSIEVALNGLLRRMQEAKLQQMRFVSDASHELRTPIAVVQGYVGMLDRWGKTDEAVLDESIEALKAETAHMKELVEQLLFLARGDSGRTTLNRVPLNLAATVREVWEESRMIDDGYDYLLDLPEGAEGDRRFAMVGDVALVKQSLRIMVSNAAKYSPVGSRIKLGVGCDPAAREVSFSVQDEGVGMSAQDASHVFERFWRSDEARSGGVEGTGLGLSIAKWIVDAHEGHIDVLSVEGVGTRFTVRFPA